MLQPFVDSDLQGVVVRNGVRRPEDGVRTEAYVGHPQIGVTPSRGLDLFREQCSTSSIGWLITIGINLAIHGVLRSCNVWLVEGNRLCQVYSMIACVPDRDCQILHCLPLHIETPVDRVGQLVARIITAEQERSRPANQASLVGNQTRYGF